MIINLKTKEEINVIECHAQSYWNVSKVWNDKMEVKPVITVSDAMKKLRHIVNNTNPIRPVAIAAEELLHDIIHNAKG